MFLKYKLFLAAPSEQLFATKLVDFDYEGISPNNLLTQLQTLEIAFKEPSTVRSVHKVFKQCSHCGRRNHEEYNCRFKNVTCFKCQKNGHFASACKNSKPVEASKNDKTDSRFSSKEYKEKKKKKVKKLTEMSDSEVNFSLNKIVIQWSSLEPFVIQAAINNQ